MLRLYALFIGHAVVPCFMALTEGRPRGRVYYYLGASNPQFEARSPGTLLTAHALQEALAERASAFDFLRGREPYRYLWAARDEMTWRR